MGGPELGNERLVHARGAIGYASVCAIDSSSKPGDGRSTCDRAVAAIVLLVISVSVVALLVIAVLATAYELALTRIGHVKSMVSPAASEAS